MHQATIGPRLRRKSEPAIATRPATKKTGTIASGQSEGVATQEAPALEKQPEPVLEIRECTPRSASARLIRIPPPEIRLRRTAPAGFARRELFAGRDSPAARGGANDRMRASRASRRCTISSAVSASRFRRSTGSVFDARRLNHQVG